MNEEKEIISFEDLYRGKKERSSHNKKPENKHGYIYALLVYGIIMYVLATVFVLIMLEIPSLSEKISESELLINQIASDPNSLALVSSDTWDLYREDYKEYVTTIGFYEDYLVIVNTSNPSVEETMFTTLPDGVTSVFDPIKLKLAIQENPIITTWNNSNAIHLYQAKSLSVPSVFAAEHTLIDGEKHVITDNASSLLNFIVYILLIPGIIYFMKSDLVYDYKEFREQKKEVIIPIIIGYAYVWIGNIVSTVLSSYFSGLFDLQISEAANQQAIISAVSSSLGILMVISAVFIGPVIEELIFRKALFGLIKNDRLALLASTLIFGLIHVVGERSFAEALINGSSYFIMGFVFGYIYIKANRNIMIPTLVHIINNAVSIFFIFMLI